MAYTVQEGESGEKRDRVRRLKLQLKHHIRAEQGLNKNTVQTHNEVDPNYTWSRERVSVISDKTQRVTTSGQRSNLVRSARRHS